MGRLVLRNRFRQTEEEWSLPPGGLFSMCVFPVDIFNVIMHNTSMQKEFDSVQAAADAMKKLQAFINLEFGILNCEVRNNFQPGKPATKWYVKGNEGWEFNHLEVGHCVNNSPTPKQKVHESSWKNRKWAKVFVRLHGYNSVVEANLIVS